MSLSPLSAYAVTGNSKLSNSPKTTITSTEQKNTNTNTNENEIIYYTYDDLLNLVSSSTNSLDEFKLSGANQDINTFDETKTFSGTAEVGAEITATIYIKNSQDNYTKLENSKNYSVTVGKSSLFKLDMDLVLGESVIIIEGTKDTKKSAQLFNINRKSIEVKEALKQNIKENIIKILQ